MITNEQYIKLKSDKGKEFKSLLALKIMEYPNHIMWWLSTHHMIVITTHHRVEVDRIPLKEFLKRSILAPTNEDLNWQSLMTQVTR